MNDKDIQAIYKKFLVKRTQEMSIAKTVVSNIIIKKTPEEAIYKRMEYILKCAMQLPQVREVSKQQIDQTMKDVSNLFDNIVMHLDPDVISALMYEQLKIAYEKKILASS